MITKDVTPAGYGIEPEADQPATETPKLSDCGMLFTLNVSLWTARAQDKEMVELIADSKATDDKQKEAIKKSITVGKKLMDGDKAYQKLVDLKKDAYDYNKKVGIQYDKGKTRFIPNRNMQEHVQKFLEFEADWDVAMQSLLVSYEFGVAEQEARLGDLFDSSKYPPVSEIENKCGFRFSYDYVPDRTNVSESQMSALEHLTGDMAEAVKQNIQVGYDRQYKQMLDDMVTQLTKPLQNLADKMADDNEKSWKGTLIPNILDEVKRIKAGNVGNNQVLADACAKLERTLRPYKDCKLKDKLEGNDSLRRQLRATAQAGLSAIATLDLNS